MITTELDIFRSERIAQHVFLGQEKNRQHRRLACPSSYVLSIDIVGPFIPGVDQEINGPRYGLVAVYSVPVNGEGVPLPEGLTQLRNQVVPGEEDGDMDVEDHQPDHHRPDWELEPELVEQLPEDEVQQQEVNEQRWKEYLKDRRAQPVRSLTFGVPLKSREASVRELAAIPPKGTPYLENVNL